MNPLTVFAGGVLLIWIVSTGRAKAVWDALVHPNAPVSGISPGTPTPNPYPHVPPGQAGPSVPPGWG